MSDYYVDGISNGNGSSWAQAATDIPVTTALNAGDRVIVKKAPYPYSAYTITKGGTSADRLGRIWFVGFDDGAGKPIISGFYDGVGYNNIGILNFEMTHQSPYVQRAISNYINGTGWYIEGNYIHNTYNGGIEIHTHSCHNTLIRRNTISQMGMITGFYAGGQGGITIKGSGGLAEYNSIDQVTDYFSNIGGRDIVIRNNYCGFTTEYLFPQFLPPVSSGIGAWDSGTMTWTNSGGQQIYSPVNYIAQIYSLVSGTPFSFYGRILTSGNSTVTISNNVSQYFGTGGIPPNGSGYRIIISAGAHIDLFQPGAITGTVVENQYFENNCGYNSHSLLLQDYQKTNSWSCIERGGVIRNVGQGTEGLDGITNFRAYHNTYDRPFFFLTNTGHDDYCVYGAGQPTFLYPSGNLFVNNGWINSARSVNTNIFGGVLSGLIDHHNAVFGGNKLTGLETQTGDPNLDSYYMPGTDSPYYSGGGGITYASGIGNDSTTLITLQSDCFFGGNAFRPPDWIQIGTGALVQISSINGHTIILQSGRSWNDGDAIKWNGYTDIGAIQYQTGTRELTGVYSYLNGQYTTLINNDSLVEQVGYYGEYDMLDYMATSSPWTYTTPTQNVTNVRIYSKFASPTPVIDASRVSDITFLRLVRIGRFPRFGVYHPV